jgi:hypothetical protein
MCSATRSVIVEPAGTSYVPAKSPALSVYQSEFKPTTPLGGGVDVGTTVGAEVGASVGVGIVVGVAVGIGVGFVVGGITRTSTTSVTLPPKQDAQP